MNELAPKSNRSSFVNFGNVTGNNRKRVARISKICNSVKLNQTRFSFVLMDTSYSLTVRNFLVKILIEYH